MDAFDDSPQLGQVDVDRDALGGAGLSLVVVAQELHASIDSASAKDAPSEGWRVLRRYPTDSVLLGAPTSQGSEWRIAQAQLGSVEGAVIRVRPDVLRLRPGRAERRRGLSLRWPSVVQADAGSYFIDVVNSGDGPWIAAGDSFYAVGAFFEPGATDIGFGWARLAQEDAVPLGPGDYARVPVRIDPGAWADLEPGVYELHAVLVDLGLRTSEPLLVTLSSETIASHRVDTRRRQPSAEERRQSLDTRIEQLRGQIAAGSSLTFLAEALADASDEADALVCIAAILGCDGLTARSVYQAPLRDLHPAHTERLEQQLEQLRLRRQGLERQ